MPAGDEELKKRVSGRGSSICKGPEVRKHDVLGPVSQLNHSDKLINDQKSSYRVAWLKPSGTNNSPFHRGERLLLNSASHRASWRAAKSLGTGQQKG